MTTKRDTYQERVIIHEEIQKVKKSIEGLERKKDKIDETSFDVKSGKFKPEAILKMDTIDKKILLKEDDIKTLNQEHDRLLELQIEVEVIL